MNIIKCNKCGKEIPEKQEKKYKFLWWCFSYSQDVTDYWHLSEEFGVHLCLDCMKLFKRWLRE